MKISLAQACRILGIQNYSPSERYDCPLCSIEALSVGEGDSGAMYHCFACERPVHGYVWERSDNKPKVRRTKPITFKEKVCYLARKQQTKSRQEKNKQAKIEFAEDIVAEAKKSRKKPEAYLRARGIERIPDNAYLLPANAKESPFPGHPCAVFEVKGGGACHVITLNKRGDGKADMENPKRTYGPISGRYVEVVPPDPDKPLIVAEGIETAASASQLAGGMPAIATLGTSGMKAVRIPDCSEVIIAADTGATGQEAARQLAADLADSHTARIVTPPKERWSDWNDVLRSRNAERWWQVALKQSIEAIARCHALTMSEFETLEAPPVGRLMDPILTDMGMYQLSAPSGHGKSRLALSISHALATASKLLGWTVPGAVRVLYVDAELHASTMKEWLDRLGSKTENFRVLSDKVNYAKGWPRVTLQTLEGRKYVSRVIEECHPKFIVLDSLFTLTTPDLERDVEMWNELLPWFESLILKDRVPFLLHHDNRTGQPFGTSTREIKFEGIAQLKRVEKLNTEDRWAFKLSWYKPRHLTPDEAKPKLITVNHEGMIGWQLGDRDPNPRNTKLTKEQRAEIEKLLGQGKMSQTQIAEKFGITKMRVSQIKKGTQDADM